MFVHLSWSRLAAPLALAAVTALAGNASAQQQLAPLTELESAHSKHYALIEKLKTGLQKPGPAEKDAIDVMAKWLVYRFVATPQKAEDMAKFQKDFKYFVDRVEDPLLKDKTRDFVKQIGPVLVKRYKDLFDKDFQEYRVPIVNAAPTLAQAARFKDPAIGAYLAEVLLGSEGAKDSSKQKHGVLKLYAAKGLREFFPAGPLDLDADMTAAETNRKTREGRYVDALTNFIEKSGGGEKMSAPEQDGIRYLRREAIESLAHAQAPAVAGGKGKIEAPIAPILLRVLAPKSGLEPAPGLPERLEAAIGVCQMKYGKISAYQPEMGLYLVGLFVQDFATAYNKDLAIILDPTKRRPAAMHWRIEYKRVEQALKDLATNAKDHPIKAKADQFSTTATALLSGMKGPQLQQINQNELVTFRKMVTGLRPTDKTVYKGIKTYVIDLE